MYGELYSFGECHTDDIGNAVHEELSRDVCKGQKNKDKTYSKKCYHVVNVTHMK